MPKSIQESADELDALRSEIAELDSVTEPTEEQSARFAAALDEWDVLKPAHDALVARAEKVAAIRSAALDPANIERTDRGPAVHIKRDPFADLDQVRFMDPSGSEVRARAVEAVEATGARAKSAHVDEALRKIEDIDGVAALALATAAPAYRSAFRTWAQAQGQNPLYSPEEAAAVRAALSLTTSTGGFTLPFLLDPTIILTGTATKNPIRRLARVEQGTQNKWNGVSAGNVTAYWTAEATAMTEGSPTFAQPTVTAAKITAYLKGSFEIWEDSSLQSQMPALIADAFDLSEAAAFVSGSGSNAPKGIVTAISATAGSTVTATTRGSFGAVDLFNVVDAVPVRYEDSTTWLANKKTYSAIRQFSTSSTGALFWSDLGTATPNTLLESPYATAADMASALTSGTVLMILGDWSQFLIYDRLGTTVEFDSIVVNGDGLPTGERALVAHKRVGSDVTDVNAFRFLKT